jgi:hypothetical protein
LIVDSGALSRLSGPDETEAIDASSSIFISHIPALLLLYRHGVPVIV